MTITMVKKVLADGSPCRKCIQAEDMLRRRNLWDRIDSIVIADDRDPTSEGFKRAEALGIDTAPFFLVSEEDGERVFTSPLALIREVLKPHGKKKALVDVNALQASLEKAGPEEIIRQALQLYGSDCAIAFSGAEDVTLIEMAAATNLPFSVFCLDTGRLHRDTLEYIESVRNHYGITITTVHPEADALGEFVREKGLFSFFTDGHKECCAIRKVAPLRRILRTKRAWITGQRRDQSTTRTLLHPVEADNAFEGTDGPLTKFNPLAEWSSDQVWAFLKKQGVPTNPLHSQGYRSIGCEPCTRPTTPEQHEREGRWWWEDDFKKECGLHLTEGTN
jgi:phosphoadenosine phosphosulfate reductase